MRVLILSQYYRPEPIPKPSELASSLIRQGDEVTVVTGFPNYPSGKLYKGYRLGLLRKEQLDGVQVIRTFSFPYHGRSVMGRFLNYVSFMLSAPLALPRSTTIRCHLRLPSALNHRGLSAWVIAATTARSIRIRCTGHLAGSSRTRRCSQTGEFVLLPEGVGAICLPTEQIIYWS